MKRATWIVAGLSVLAAGCSSTAPTANQNAPAQPPAQMTSERSVLADGVTTSTQLSQILPSKLTQAEGDRLLVDLPTDKIKGSLQVNQDGRQIQQWYSPYRYRYYRYGSLYYPYYLYSGYYYPYYSYYTPNYYYPYYYGYGSYYYPYRYTYRRYWW